PRQCTQRFALSFSFNATAPPPIYTLSLHDALPISSISGIISPAASGAGATVTLSGAANGTTNADASGNYSFGGLANGSYTITPRSEDHTSELQSLTNLVCRLLLEKKKTEIYAYMQY